MCKAGSLLATEGLAGRGNNKTLGQACSNKLQLQASNKQQQHEAALEAEAARAEAGNEAFSDEEAAAAPSAQQATTTTQTRA